MDSPGKPAAGTPDKATRRNTREDKPKKSDKNKERKGGGQAKGGWGKISDHSGSDAIKPGDPNYEEKDAEADVTGEWVVGVGQPEAEAEAPQSASSPVSTAAEFAAMADATVEELVELSSEELTELMVAFSIGVIQRKRILEDVASLAEHRAAMAAQQAALEAKQQAEAVKVS